MEKFFSFLNDWLNKLVGFLDREVPPPAPEALPIPASFGAFQEEAQKIANQLLRAAPGTPRETVAKMICQMAIETGYGQSHLCKNYNNFAGMEWRHYHGTVLPGATKVSVVTSDGAREYCSFASLQDFAEHYILRLDRGPYPDWRYFAQDEDIGFLRVWAGDPKYVEKIEAKFQHHFHPDRAKVKNKA